MAKKKIIPMNFSYGKHGLPGTKATTFQEIFEGKRRSTLRKAGTHGLKIGDLADVKDKSGNIGEVKVTGVRKVDVSMADELSKTERWTPSFIKDYIKSGNWEQVSYEPTSKPISTKSAITKTSKSTDTAKYIEIKGPFHLRDHKARERVSAGIRKLAEEHPDATFVLREGKSKNIRRASVYSQTFDTLSYLKQGKRIKVIEAEYGKGGGGVAAREAAIEDLLPFKQAEFTYSGKPVTEDYDFWRQTDIQMSEEKVFDPLRSKTNKKTGERYLVKKYPSKSKSGLRKIDAFLDKVSEYAKTKGYSPAKVDAALEYLQDKADLFHEQQRVSTKRVIGWNKKTGVKTYNPKDPIHMISGDRARRMTKLQKDYGIPKDLTGKPAISQQKTGGTQVPIQTDPHKLYYSNILKSKLVKGRGTYQGLSPEGKKEFGAPGQLEPHKKGELATGLIETDADRTPPGIQMVKASDRNIDEFSSLEGPYSPEPIERATIPKDTKTLYPEGNPNVNFDELPQKKLKGETVDKHQPMSYTAKQGTIIGSFETGWKETKATKRSLFPTAGLTKKSHQMNPFSRITSSLGPLKKEQSVEFDIEESLIRQSQQEEIRGTDFEAPDIGEDRGGGAHYQVDKGDLKLGKEYGYLSEKEKDLAKELAGIEKQNWATEVTVNKKDLKVISGGQIGADRMGLEIGKKLGFKTGGTAPIGFDTQVGFDPSLKQFGVVEVSAKDTTDYAQRTGTKNKYGARTEQNVLQSDVTFLFTTPEHKDSPGSKLTRKLAILHGKPLIENPTPQAIEKLASSGIKINTVNIAGNRQFEDKKAISNALIAFGKTVKAEQQKQWITKKAIGDTKKTTPNTLIQDILQGDAIDPVADPRHGDQNLITSSTSPDHVTDPIKGAYKPNVLKDPYVDRPRKPKDPAYEAALKELDKKDATSLIVKKVDQKGNVYEKIESKYPGMSIQEQLDEQKIHREKVGSTKHEAIMRYNQKRDAEIKRLSDSGELKHVSTVPAKDVPAADKKDVKPKTIRQQNYDANQEQLSLIRRKQKPGEDISKKVENLQSNIKQSLRGEKVDTFTVTDEKGNKKTVKGDVSFAGEGSGPMTVKSVNAPPKVNVASDKARAARALLKGAPKILLGPALLGLTPYFASQQLKAKGIDKPTTGDVVQENIAVFTGAPRVYSGVGEKPGYLQNLGKYDITAIRESGKRRVQEPIKGAGGKDTPFAKMKKSISGAMAEWSMASEKAHEAMKTHGSWRFK